MCNSRLIVAFTLAAVFVVALTASCDKGMETVQSLRVPTDYATIQDAVDAARDGDVVFVSEGTYQGKGNRDISFAGKSLTVRSEEGPEVTTIDCEGSNDNPHRAFVIRGMESQTVILDGFTITNGVGSVEGDSREHGRGGAVYCDAPSLHLTNCVFESNEARLGGAVWCGRMRLSASDCDFIGNTASSLAPGDTTVDCLGGAIAGTGGRAEFNSCRFLDNRSDYAGAAVKWLSVQGCSFQDCEISRNSGYWGAALYLSNGDIDLTGCLISDNVIEVFHGTKGLQVLFGRTHVENCIINGNSENGLAGDHFVCVLAGEQAIMRDCTITGGLMHLGCYKTFVYQTNFFASKLYLISLFGPYPRDTIEYCVFDGNYLEGSPCEYPGAIEIHGGSPLIKNCTVFASEIRVWNAAPLLENCIVAYSEDYSALVLMEGHDPSYETSLSCCDFFANRGGDWVGPIENQLGENGNMSVAPGFCATADEKLLLQRDSPCTADNSPCGSLIGALDVGCEWAPY